MNLPEFDTFEVITQADTGGILKVFRKLLDELSDSSKIKPDLLVLIDKFEKGIIIPVHRACDLRKPGCEKLEDGTLVFPGLLNHYAQSSDDYLQHGKAWSEVERWVNDAVDKFYEDQRRMDTAMKRNLENN